MYSTIPAPVMGKLSGRLGFLTLVWQPVSEKENSEFEPGKLCLKTDLKSHFAHVEWLGKYIHIFLFS